MNKFILPTLLLVGTSACEFHARTPDDYQTATRSVLDTRSAQIKSCYDEVLKQDKTASGTVVVHFTVMEETGAITGAEVTPESTAPAPLGQCIVGEDANCLRRQLGGRLAQQQVLADLGVDAGGAQGGRHHRSAGGHGLQDLETGATARPEGHHQGASVVQARQHLVDRAEHGHATRGEGFDRRGRVATHQLHGHRRNLGLHEGQHLGHELHRGGLVRPVAVLADVEQTLAGARRLVVHLGRVHAVGHDLDPWGAPRPEHLGVLVAGGERGGGGRDRRPLDRSHLRGLPAPPQTVQTAAVGTGQGGHDVGLDVVGVEHHRHAGSPDGADEERGGGHHEVPRAGCRQLDQAG